MFTKSLCLSFCIFLFIFTSTNSLIAQTPREEHCLTFDSAAKTITVSCKNGTLSQARIMLNDNNVLKEESNGIWLLKANLFIDKNSTFTIAPYDAKWLKIQTPFGVNSLGNLIINSVKITSWDGNTGTYVSTNGTVPRPYLTEDNGFNGQMNITDSEIAYLGYNRFDKQGITYIGGDGSMLSGNDIHDMWYGFYSAKRANITITDNHIHNNERFGIDPHTGTNHTIRNNTVNDIRNGIGIICSDHCSDILIEDNLVYNTTRAGIMLDATDSSIVRNNVEYDSRGAGIAVHGSSAMNKVYNNTVNNNRYGIKISLNSTANEVFGNRILNSSNFGLCITENSTRNDIKLNQINGSKNNGICVLSGASGNNVESNIISNASPCGILKKDDLVNFFKNNTLYSSVECTPVMIQKYFGS